MATRSRHVPLRTCVICSNKAPKAELTRIVATPQGNVTIDPTGKLPGRGAYVCGVGDCAEQGLKRGRLEHLLRAKLKDEEWASLNALNKP